MSGTPTNKMVVERLEEGGLSVEFVDLSPEEYATQPAPQSEPAYEGFDLELSEDGKEDPILRMMASECAIYGLSRRPGHIWGE